MKRINSCFVLALFTTILAYAGCSIEAPIKMGEFCGKDEGGPNEIISASVQCTRDDVLNHVGSCGQFADSYEYERCPEGFVCNETTQICSASITCTIGQHIDGGVCKDDDIYNCGMTGNACATLTGWLDGECINSKCVVAKCDAAYELIDGRCEARTTCPIGLHMANGSCEEDSVEACGSLNNNCTKAAGWLEGDCVDATCIASKCTNGYELEDNLCVALVNCGEGLHLNNGQCEPDTVNACGSANNDCTTAAGWLNGTCENAQCIASECDSGYELNDSTCKALINCGEGLHLNNGHCEQDTVNACGSANNDCTTAAGWLNGTCEDAQCIASECDSGYELNDDTCKAITTCADGFHYYKGLCEPDSLANCGSHDNICASLAGWSNGKCTNGTCVATACDDGYKIVNNTCTAITCSSNQHIYNSTCEADSISNCGEHGTTCNQAIGEACVNKQCTVTCIDGYRTVLFDGDIINAACVSSAEDFKNIGASPKAPWPDSKNTLNAYILTQDIDLGNNNYSFGNFEGILLGDGHTMSGTILGSVETGLFNYISNSVIDGINCKVNILNGSHGIGGLGYSIRNSTVRNSKFSGTITGDIDVGGIAGDAYQSTFDNCEFSGTVIGIHNSFEGYNCGGFAGNGTSLIITNSRSSGIVRCSNTLGGFMGYAYSDIDITASYTTTHLEATDSKENAKNVGGFIGESNKNINITISNSYSDNDIYGFNALAGFVGYANSGTTLTISNSGTFPHIYADSKYIDLGENTSGIVNADSNVSLKLNNVFVVGDYYDADSATSIASSNVTIDYNGVYTISNYSNVQFICSDFTGTVSSGNALYSYQYTSDYSATYTSQLTAKAITFTNSKSYCGSSSLTDALNAATSAGTWVEQGCILTTGPDMAETNIFYLPIPDSMVKPQNCL